MNIDFSKYPYPRKIRHHVGSNLYFPLKEMTFTPTYYPPILDDIKPALLFQNKKDPDILDIGCGKSKFLLDFADKFPEKNILGFEVRKVLVEWLQNLIKSEQIQNTWVEWYSVVNGLSFLKENSIEKVFYLFPDPWPKQKQQNRRLFSTYFLEELHRILSKEGKLFLATDCDYVDFHHRKELDKSKLFDYHTAEEKDWNFPITNKETFCKKKNIPIFRLVCEPKS